MFKARKGKKLPQIIFYIYSSVHGLHLLIWSHPSYCSCWTESIFNDIPPPPQYPPHPGPCRSWKLAFQYFSFDFWWNGIIRISSHANTYICYINLGDIELNSYVNKGFQIVSVRIHRVDTLQDSLAVERMFTISLFAQQAGWVIFWWEHYRCFLTMTDLDYCLQVPAVAPESGWNVGLGQLRSLLEKLLEKLLVWAVEHRFLGRVVDVEDFEENAETYGHQDQNIHLHPLLYGHALTEGLQGLSGLESPPVDLSLDPE